MGKDDEQVVAEFREAVNMDAEELESWLDTDASRSVGQSGDEDEESVGHASGRRIVALLRADDEDVTDEDLGHMRKVVGYVHRHRAQEPSGDVTDTAWRHSLMNWGHDPLRN
jgi:hypothetical protein